MKQIDPLIIEALESGVAHEDGATVWWTEDPETGKFFLEFSNTRIWNPPIEKDSVPNTQIQLIFSDVLRVVFGREDTSSYETDWPQQVHDDALKVHIIPGQIFLNNLQATQQHINRIKHHDLIRGNPINSPEFLNAAYIFSVEIDSAIIVISANSLKLRNWEEEIPLENLGEKVEKWWLYYKEYWIRRDTNNPMAYDSVCETMIPIDI